MIAQSHTAFLSASLAYEDRPIMDFFRRSLFENGIRPVTIGIDIPARSDYEAASIAPQVVRGCDCVIAIQTRRYQTIDGKFKSSEWTIEEPTMGITQDKPLYVFRENGVVVKGASASRARMLCEFSRDGLQTQRDELMGRCAQIADELASMKRQGLLSAVGTLAIIGGSAYVLYKLLGGDEENEE
ncbi:MAG: hypothetical protein NT137_01350 [Methanomassiliicoccales archaeon]|nr:hypothetical protein [Methanomassiliicoccales archaeon]